GRRRRGRTVGARRRVEARAASRTPTTRHDGGLLRRVASALAARAPVGDAIRLALPSGADRLAAPRTGPAGAPIDAAPPSLARHGSRHQPVRSPERAPQIVVVRVA